MYASSFPPPARATRSRSAGEVPDKARLPLSVLANIRVDKGRTQINREQGGRFLAVKTNIEGRDMGTFVEEAQRRVQSEVHLPDGYHLTWGGEFENQRRAMRRLLIIVPISVALIFVPYTWRSGRRCRRWWCCSTCRLRPSVACSLYLTHTVLSVSAAVGFITLFGSR